jgi:hypothetical protein
VATAMYIQYAPRRRRDKWTFSNIAVLLGVERSHICVLGSKIMRERGVVCYAVDDVPADSHSNSEAVRCNAF